MLWFLNNFNSNSNDMIKFYQVFIDSNEVYSDCDKNIIYSFNSINSTNLNNLKFNIDLTKHETKNINCKIKIIDNIISYEIINENKNYVFSTKSDFTKPENDTYGIPIFSHMYKSTSVKRLPNLIETKYTNVYELNFEIYNIESNDNKVQFIVETNLSTNEKRKYFIIENLDYMKKYFNK